uniref:Uncharacterized protein n=1 Tax=Rhizophora mucronata TaxID=61149 RepID=A0A2P2N0I5_RHIMU
MPIPAKMTSLGSERRLQLTKVV